LIQTAGRAARHLHGEVILYADVMTISIQKFLAVSEYRRKKQIAYNLEHNITPRSVVRAIEESLGLRRGAGQAAAVINDAGGDFDVAETLRQLEEEMLAAANNLEFEKAALLRDQIRELKRGTGDGDGAGGESRMSYSPKAKRGRKAPQRNVTAKLRRSMRQ
jgi:excinuclease ABC subunit B